MIGSRSSDDQGALDDARLAARIASGDEAAFVIAYDRHAGFVFGSVVRFVGDREVAAEVVQDAFMALWRRARQFDARAGSLSPAIAPSIASARKADDPVAIPSTSTRSWPMALARVARVPTCHRS